MACIAGSLLFVSGIRDAHAQSSLSLTVTPPLYQLHAQPGEVFASSITLVNTNPFPLSLYLEPVVFAPQGERGQGVLRRPGVEDAHHLTGWITLFEQMVTIEPGTTRSVEFTIAVPADAAPGGHYAALLVGTQPPESRPDTSAVSVASSIASLVFLRVAGDVIEQGMIREFSTDRHLYQRPEAQFTLRFQNTGNVHVQPTGNITIYNMWGTERGQIALSSQNEFGNVLPGSVRAFSFTWRSDENIFDFGRYHAVATLTYGTEARKNEHREVHFWVVPVAALIQVVGGAIVLFGFLLFMVRRYVRYALAIEAERIRAHTPEREAEETDTPSSLVRTLVRPIRGESVDLRAPQSSAEPREGAPHVESSLTHNASLVHSSSSAIPADPPRLSLATRLLWGALFILVVILIGYLIRAYLTSVFTYERAYEVYPSNIDPDTTSAPNEL